MAMVMIVDGMERNRKSVGSGVRVDRTGIQSERKEDESVNC